MSAPWIPDWGRESRSSSTCTMAGARRPGVAVGSLGAGGPLEQADSTRLTRIMWPRRFIKFECNSPPTQIPPYLLSLILWLWCRRAFATPHCDFLNGGGREPGGRLAPDISQAERLGAGVSPENGADLADLDLGTLQLSRQLLADPV